MSIQRVSTGFPFWRKRSASHTNGFPVCELIWPDFCSALIVGRLAPLGLHNTRFRSVPVSCDPRAGADASSPRHETHRNVANSRSLKSWKGLRRQTSSVLHAPSALPAMALSYESPTVPVEGSMPNSPTLVVYTRLMYLLRAMVGMVHETVRAAMRGGP